MTVLVCLYIVTLMTLTRSHRSFL